MNAGDLTCQHVNRLNGNNMPVVSIITAVYNSDEFLEETILSVLNQTYPNIEYIIIDGGSRDNSLDIIKMYTNKIDFWVSENDSSIYEAWNKGVELCTGEWIGFLGADDIYKNDAIENYISRLMLEAHWEEIDLISSKVLSCNNKLKPIRLIGEAWSWSRFKRYMNIVHVGALHNRNYFYRYGTFNLEYNLVADYEFLLRAKNTLKALFLEEVTAMIRIGGLSETYKSINQSYIAKVLTGGRNSWVSRAEQIYAYLALCYRKNAYNLIRSRKGF